MGKIAFHLCFCAVIVQAPLWRPLSSFLVSLGSDGVGSLLEGVFVTYGAHS